MPPEQSSAPNGGGGAFLAGSWSYDTGPALSGRYHTVEHAAGYMVCECYEGSEADQERNAKLIAAAPELLQSARLLESLCAWLLNAHGPDSPEGKEASFRATQVRLSLRKALGTAAAEQSEPVL